MTDRLLPATAYQDVVSHLENPQPKTTELSTAITELEFRILSSNAKKEAITRYKLFREKPTVSYTEARTMAETEFSALWASNPRITHFMPQFPSLYRLMRTAELTGNLRRHGETLLLGSGLTVPEVLAVQIDPPEIEKIEALEDLNLLEMALNMPDLNFTSSGPPITAIEPKDKYRNLVAQYAPLFNLVPSDIHLITATVGEAAENGTIPNNRDLIVWNRAEPAIVYGHQNGSSIDKRTKRENLAKLKEFLGVLTSFLAPDGSIFITTGTGNNCGELEARKLLLEQSRYALSEIGFVIGEKIPTIFVETKDNILFNPEHVGLVGCVVAKKSQG